MATILITGANQGIGLEMVKQYCRRGDQVLAVCRVSNSELEALDCEIISGIDLAGNDVAELLQPAVGSRKIDILINNAGILSRETLDDLDFDRMRAQYEVNALGPLKVTRAMLNNLADAAKIAIVTSRVGSLGDNASGGNYGYRMSKAAANMAGVNLMHDLKPEGIAVILLHPGYVSTNMTNYSGMTDAASAAKGLIARIDDLDMATTGTFWHAEGYELPW